MTNPKRPIEIRHSAAWRDKLPFWLFDRIEVNTYWLRRFVYAAAQALPAHSLVLDAGAGDGRFAPLFSHVRLVKVDLAVGDAQWDYSGLDGICNLESLPFPADCFDAVVCTQVLEHVREPSTIIGEFERVLKPGGKVILSAPLSWYEHQIPHDYFRYTSYGFAYLLEKNRLVVDQIKSLGGYFWHLSFHIQSFTRWVFNANPAARKHRTLLLPFKLLSVVLFELLLPLLLFYLDPLDPVKQDTFGHFCTAHKPLHGASGEAARHG